MKRTFLFGQFLLLCCICIAQGTYVKVKQKTETDGVTLFRDEILLVKSRQNGKSVLGFGTRDIEVDNKVLEKVEYSTLDQKDFTGVARSQRIDDRQGVWIDVTGKLNPRDNDTMLLAIPVKGDAVAFVTKTKDHILDFCPFRIVIKNSPTIFFECRDLVALNDSTTPPQVDPNVTTTAVTEEEGDGTLFWIIVGIVMLLTIGAGLWYFFKIRNTAVYSSGTLDSFATQNGIDIALLQQLNPSAFGTRDYQKMTRDQKSEQDTELRYKRLVIGPKPSGWVAKSQANNWDQGSSTESGTLGNENGGNTKTNTQQSGIDTRGLMTEVSKEISKLLAAQTSSLQSYVTESIRKIQTDNSEALRELRTAITKEIGKLGEQKESPLVSKVMAVEFIRSRCSLLNGYLKEVQVILKDVYKDYYRLSSRDSTAAIAFGQILLKFQSKKTLLEETWGSCLADISATGYTANGELMKLFHRMDNERYDDAQREREFLKLLNVDGLFERHLSSALVLVEDLRNIDRFVPSSSNVEEIKGTYSNHLETLKHKCRTLGIEPKYVPLFVDYAKGSTPTKLANIDYPSEPHSKIIGLPKDSIIEVVSYGFKSDLGDSDTLIIKV